MTTDRISWFDTARGFAVVLVALGHATMILVEEGVSSPVWYVLSQLALAIRMPLFFALSGMLAIRIVDRSWRDLWDRRLALLLWMILVWTVIRFAWFSLLPIDSFPHYADPSVVLISPVWPTGIFWFLQALALYLVVGKVMNGRVPVWVQLSGAAVLSAVALGALGSESGSYQRAAGYLFFFLLGLHGRRRIVALAERRRPFVAAGLLAAVVLASGLIFAVDLDHVPGVLTALGVPAVLATVLALRAIDGTSVARILQSVGRHSLPVFVIHVLVIVGITRALLLLPEVPAPVQAVLPPVVATLAVVSSLVVWRLTRRIPGLYTAPRILMTRSRLRTSAV
ncbi:acyltransferase family protein [Plantibacter sp. ME-Dv--P-095]|uniref:acyltransferase family protein n=1 Tax=Plantibacter sp. ME-Dv--P-095 TaxID=3040299 RepID=UPI00254E5FEE|nr:acyltransferase family protein [Plantibacter sp. ME-Dv--P-095]